MFLTDFSLSELLKVGIEWLKVNVTSSQSICCINMNYQPCNINLSAAKLFKIKVSFTRLALTLSVNQDQTAKKSYLILIYTATKKSQLIWVSYLD